MKPPLAGIRIVEFEGIGPGPLAGRMLADMGAEVTVIARPQKGAVAKRLGGAADNPLRRGKTVVLLDLKQASGVAEAMALVAGADALIEGNRPGVMERLGLAPAARSMARSPAHSTIHPSMTSMPAPTVAPSRLARWSRSSMRCCWTSSVSPTWTQPRSTTRPPGRR